MNEGNKTRRDISEDETCCLCFPLKYGLISWGYFKIVSILTVNLLMEVGIPNVCIIITLLTYVNNIYL